MKTPFLKISLSFAVLSLFFMQPIQAKTTDLKTNDRLVFTPLLADPLEPRMGTLFNTAKKDLLLDIGATFDLIDFLPDSSCANKLSFGGHMATYSVLRRTSNFKFPVDAIDYIFGVNASYKTNTVLFGIPGEFQGRFRLSHISAHFVDGHVKDGVWDQENVPFQIPFVYSREFINVQAGFSTQDYRAYVGYQLMFHTIPADINPHSMQIGLELYRNNCKIPGIYPFLATDFKLNPIWDAGKDETDGFAGCINLQVGFKTNPIPQKGMRVVLNYSNGMDHHGMYFYKRTSTTSLGILLDF